MPTNPSRLDLNTNVDLARSIVQEQHAAAEAHWRGDDHDQFDHILTALHCIDTLEDRGWTVDIW